MTRTKVLSLLGLLLLASCQPPQGPRYVLLPAYKDAYLVRMDTQTGKTWALLVVSESTWTEVKEPFPLPR